MKAIINDYKTKVKEFLFQFSLHKSYYGAKRKMKNVWKMKWKNSNICIWETILQKILSAKNHLGKVSQLSIS